MTDPSPVFVLTVRYSQQDTPPAAVFSSQGEAEENAIATVDPYETGEYDRAFGQGGAVVFITSEAAQAEGEEEAEARVTPTIRDIEPVPAHEAEEEADSARVGEVNEDGLTYQGNGVWARVGAIDTICALEVGQTVHTDQAGVTKTDEGFMVSTWPDRRFRSAWDAWTAAGQTTVHQDPTIASDPQSYTAHWVKAGPDPDHPGDPVAAGHYFAPSERPDDGEQIERIVSGVQALRPGQFVQIASKRQIHCTIHGDAFIISRGAQRALYLEDEAAIREAVAKL